MARYRWAADSVRLAGAAYLAWLGLRMILNSRRALPAAAPVPVRAAAVLAAVAVAAAWYTAVACAFSALIRARYGA